KRMIVAALVRAACGLAWSAVGRPSADHAKPQAASFVSPRPGKLAALSPRPAPARNFWLHGRLSAGRISSKDDVLLPESRPAQIPKGGPHGPATPLAGGPCPRPAQHGGRLSGPGTPAQREWGR